MFEALETIFYAVLTVGTLAYYARDRVTALRDRLTDRPDELTRRYLDGEIDESEYERQRGFDLDDRNEQIQAVVEDVPGISEARSKAIAREYESLADLRGSSRERLESVPDIGPARAENVLEWVREE